MVEETFRVENPANKPMHYNKRVDVGILTPPDYLPMRKLYSYFDGLAFYNQLDYDTYELQKKAKPKKGKFPTILKLLGVGVLGTLTLFKGLKGIKRLFHKT